VLFKHIQGKVIQVVELVLLKIPDDMDQVTENGTGTGYVGNDKVWRDILALQLFEAAEVYEYRGRSIRCSFGIIQEFIEGPEVVVMDIVHHGAGKVVKRMQWDTEPVNGVGDLFEDRFPGMFQPEAIDPGIDLVGVHLLLQAAQYAIQRLTVDHTIDIPHELINGPRRPVAVIFPESGGNEYVRVVIYLVEINFSHRLTDDFSQVLYHITGIDLGIDIAFVNVSG
jgi:hypothetical protein